MRVLWSPVFSRAVFGQAKELALNQHGRHVAPLLRPLLQQTRPGQCQQKLTLRCCFSASPLTSSSLSSCTTSAAFSSLLSACSPSSLVDLSEYLIGGCDWRKAPKCPDFVGPVLIKRTPDGRGRGLYATKDVAIGDILLISNAFAASYNDCHSIELFTKIAAIVKESPRALSQFYSLAGYEYHDEIEVPPVELFDPSSAYTESQMTGSMEFDEKRIAHIMNVNSFEGELTAQKNEGAIKLNGLWLLPSFINHSCCPNASRLPVGEAMIIIASQDIRAKEEITIEYTDCLSPLKKRENVLGSIGYGFRCECKRCTAERSVQDHLEEFSDQYLALYDKASEEVYAVVTTREKSSFSACQELATCFDSVRRKTSTLENLTKLQKQWILGGYSSAFLGNWLTIGYSTDFLQPSKLVSATALELVEAMKSTVPGMPRTLSFAMILATVAQKEESQFQFVDRLLQLAIDECIRVHGKQRLDVVIKVIEQSVDIVPFF